jgi:hypothetical protein
MATFCTECGSALTPKAAFCGNCGKKVTSTLVTKSDQFAILSESPEFFQFQQVFAWVLKTHVDAIVDLTTQIAPYFNSYIVMRGNVLQSVGSENDKDDGTVENLLFRLPIVTGSQFSLDALVEVKENAVLSIQDCENLKRITNATFDVYLSTEHVLNRIKESTCALFNGRRTFTQLRKQEDITNTDALRTYEELVARFKAHINKGEFTTLPQASMDYWRQQGETHPYALLSVQNDRECLTWPWMGGRNIQTDLERAYVPYFDYTASLDKAYVKCTQLFRQCQNTTGFLRSPSTDLKNDTVAALHEFNASFMAFSSTHWYSNAKLAVIQHIKSIRTSLIDHMTNYDHNQGQQPTHRLLKQLFNIISLMNEVEPVNNFWGPLIFED